LPEELNVSSGIEAALSDTNRIKSARDREREPTLGRKQHIQQKSLILYQNNPT
jgi:hypothetical protein